ncbi:MAG: glucosamine--fructose-6-phosphate aminotransferase [Gammaproteobacteria bacterium]
MQHLTLSNLDLESRSFTRNFKHYLEQLEPDSLPLHRCTSQGGMVDDTNISVSILSVEETESTIEVKIAVFFTEIIGGCSCGDDPLSENAYGELLAIIDTASRKLTFSVLND